jgi:protein tyrosine phosphatase (PTP) superfamily phosphohydrolase (DUF442 family)
MRLALGGAIAAIGGLGIWLGVLQLTGNIHRVEPTLYRSAQLGRSALSDVIRTYHIRSVINLRGKNLNAPWYQTEIQTTQELDVSHFDFQMSANELVRPAVMLHLEQLLRNAPKPILIHCQSGADRSGLVAALYEYAIADRPEEEAEEQLSLLYGHVPYLWSRTGAMDKSFEMFVHQKENLGGLLPRNGSYAEGSKPL